MSILAGTDYGDSMFVLSVDHDPRTVATEAPAGSVILDSNGDPFHKNDDGLTTNVANICRIKTGVYTGDGTESLEIVVGFLIKFLWIWRSETLTNKNSDPYMTSDLFVDNNAEGQSIEWASAGTRTEISAIISVGTSFFVDDDAGDDHPNRTGQVYEYCAMG